METEALIIGGGVPGLTLAGLLGQAGLKVTLVDSEKMVALEDAQPSGRTAALMQGSLNIFKSLDIFSDISHEIAALKILRIIDDSNPHIEPVQIDFHADDIGLKAFGYNIPDLALRCALVDKIKTIKAVRHIAPAKLERFDIQGQKVCAVLDNGTEIKAALIVGADGRRSRTRECAGIEASAHDYGQSAITCLIDHSLPHHHVSTEFHRPGGPFTLVPMPGHQSSVVWVEKTDDAEKFMTLRKKDFQQALQDRSRGNLGEVALASTPACWPLMRLAAKRLIGTRTALIAEAAHVISPIGAQGLNLSLRDVSTLAEVIVDAARLGGDLGAQNTLTQYERRRRADVTSRVIGVDGLNKIVSNNLGLLRGMRRAGLKALDSIPPLKTFAMHQGLAPAMDEGRLMQGQSL